jgi:hypothetical protein
VIASPDVKVHFKLPLVGGILADPIQRLANLQVVRVFAVEPEEWMSNQKGSLHSEDQGCKPIRMDDSKIRVDKYGADVEALDECSDSVVVINRRC